MVFNGFISYDASSTAGSDDGDGGGPPPAETWFPDSQGLNGGANVLPPDLIIATKVPSKSMASSAAIQCRCPRLLVREGTSATFSPARDQKDIARVGGDCLFKLSWTAFNDRRPAQAGLHAASGGPDRARTDHLFHAMEALYQMSYGPRMHTPALRVGPGKVALHLHRGKRQRDIRAPEGGAHN